MQRPKLGNRLLKLDRVDVGGRHHLKPIHFVYQEYRPSQVNRPQAIQQGRDLQQRDQANVHRQFPPGLRDIEHRESEQRPQHHIHGHQNQEQLLATRDGSVNPREKHHENQQGGQGRHQQAEQQVQACRLEALFGLERNRHRSQEAGSLVQRLGPPVFCGPGSLSGQERTACALSALSRRVALRQVGRGGRGWQHPQWIGARGNAGGVTVPTDVAGGHGCIAHG